MSDNLGLHEPASGPNPCAPAPPWTVLVVDDDPEVHDVTRLALDGFSFAGRGLRFLNAYSGAEARRLLTGHHDIALMLLDVVMETDGSGLEVVEFVRHELKNSFIRIVLRTGQPGQAPELEVITRYDINDYKHKTELTRERLFTTIYTGLSTYRDLITLDAHRRGLEQVIEASAQIFELRSMDRFVQGVLEQLIALLLFDADAVVLHASGVAAEETGGDLRIVAGTGAFGALIGREARSALPSQVLDRVATARQCEGYDLKADYFISVQRTDGSGDLVFYVTASEAMPVPDRHLLRLFCRNVALARRNVSLLAASQRGDAP